MPLTTVKASTHGRVSARYVPPPHLRVTWAAHSRLVSTPRGAVWEVIPPTWDTVDKPWPSWNSNSWRTSNLYWTPNKTWILPEGTESLKVPPRLLWVWGHPARPTSSLLPITALPYSNLPRHTARAWGSLMVTPAYGHRRHKLYSFHGWRQQSPTPISGKLNGQVSYHWYSQWPKNKICRETCTNLVTEWTRALSFLR